MDKLFERFVHGQISERDYNRIKNNDKYVDGARVEAVMSSGMVAVGDTGTICHITSSWVGVHWDKSLKGHGHSCNGNCPAEHGRNMGYDMIKIIES